VIKGGNRRAFDKFGDKSGNMFLVEQYLLTACLEYHGVEIRYVFETIGSAFDKRCATEAGYTHLAAGAKRDPANARDLEGRVKGDSPEHFERCEKMGASKGKVASFWD